MEISGIINLLKPPKMTSNDAVVIARRILGIKKVGHTGTLDPAAAGVLPLTVNKATRLFDYLADKDKEYVACIRFGISTDTLDSCGEITGVSDKIVSEEVFKSALAEFEGEIEQIPPMYSAVSHNGARLYQLARAGKTVDIKSRKVTVNSLIYMYSAEVNSFVFRVMCSKGTYIRSLCADIAHNVGACAHLEYLVRARSGMFTINDALTFDELENIIKKSGIISAIVPCENAVTMPAVEIPSEYRDKLMNGAGVKWTAEPPLFKLYCAGFIGIGHAQGGYVKIKTRLI